MLRDVDVPEDGAWLKLPPIDVHAVSESGTKAKHEAQGSVELMVAWVRPSDEEEAAMRGSTVQSSELEGYGGHESGGEKESDDDDDPAAGADDETAEETLETRITQQLKPGTGSAPG